jgi:hypothetical protein
MEGVALAVTVLSLSLATVIPEAILAIIENSSVYSLTELSLAQKNNKTMYIVATENGELVGYCIVTVAYPFEVVEGLPVDRSSKILWVDVLEIANCYQGNNYGRTVFNYIRNGYSYEILLISTAESLHFWQRMGLERISYSGEIAYMMS